MVVLVRIMRKLLVEMGVLVAVSAVVAFSYNALRTEGRIRVTRNYFDRGDALVAGRVSPAQPAVETAAGPGPTAESKASTEPAPAAIESVTAPVVAKGVASGSNGRNTADTAGAHPNKDRTAQLVASASPSDASNGKPRKFSDLQHSYQEIDFDDVLAVVNDPMTAAGLNVLVDARDDDHYSEGRIAGALQCFPHEVDRYVDRIRDAVLNAEKVIVYCSGGDCEDSIFMCRELLNMSVPYENVFLYPGGWKEWVARGGPTEGAEGSP